MTPQHLAVIGYITLAFIAAPAQAQSTRFVATDGSDTGNTCEDQAQPCGTIQHAIDEADSGDMVMIFDGEYTQPLQISDKDLSFAQVTGQPVIQAAEQSETANERTVTIDGSVTVSFSGVTIRHGNATSGNGGFNALDGGGIACTSGCVLHLQDVFVRANRAGGDGGGIYMEGGGGGSTFADVVIEDNTAGFGGGGMLNDFSSPRLINVTFSGNEAEFDLFGGGGLQNRGGSSPTLLNVIFNGNVAQLGGGLSNLTLSSPVLVNVTFSGNHAREATFGGGGAMFNAEASFPVLRNAIIWNNQVGGVTGVPGASIANLVHPDIPSSEPFVAHSLIANSGGSDNWNDAIGVDDGNNIDVDALFVEPINPDDAPTTAGNLRLAEGSPAIDAGDPSTPPQDFPTNEKGDPIDLDGNPRFINTIIDIGTYELQPPPSNDIFADHFEQ